MKQTMGEMIAQLRKEKGMTQKDLADHLAHCLFHFPVLPCFWMVSSYTSLPKL